MLKNKKNLKISLLTGGDDPTYALPLLSALVSKGFEVDFIGNDNMQNAEITKHENVTFLNLRGDQNPNVSISVKISRIIKYYFKLVQYTLNTDSKLFHILWLNKFIYFDRTVLNVFYKLCGKQIIFTAHNINAGERDGNDTILNRLTLRFMYKTVDHIFVHTRIMEMQLIKIYNVSLKKITVIPFGINNILPKSQLTIIEAKKKLNLEISKKILLFFGQIAPYKGLDILLLALVILKDQNKNIKLIIAGKVKRGYHIYWENIQKIIGTHDLHDMVVQRIEFIPDDEVEVYFKAADVLILPYKNIFQSGVPFLSFNYGLPVIATDVGSLREDIVDGNTGFICRPENPNDLAEKINKYFDSKLFKRLEINRSKIIKLINKTHSWGRISDITCSIYETML